MNDPVLGNKKSIKAFGFTIIELLVVIMIVTLLLAILFPALASSKNAAKMVVCQSNLRQLVLANQGYANDNDDYSVVGALGMFAQDIRSRNLRRWYGRRSSVDEPFDTTEGPLATYLGGTEIRCPQKTRYAEIMPFNEIYEDGNGGYGYNFWYVGSRIWYSGLEEPDTSRSMKLSEIKMPQETLLFADTAAIARINGNPTLVRYSFVTPRYFIIDREPNPVWSPAPSIHFRHRKRTCVAWADGHADNRKTAEYDGRNQDGSQPLDFNLGWFEPMDNSLFDLL